MFILKIIKNIKGLSLLLLIIFISIITIEFLYRFYLFGWDSISIKKMNSVHAIGVSRLIKASNDSEIIYELKPNINTYFKLKQYTTNSYGLRDKEYTIEKPENIFRVAVIGDSYTQGSGVSINNTYHSILEGWYNNEQNDLTYQFINFGVGGYSLRQYLRVVTLKANHFNPDFRSNRKKRVGELVVKILILN